MLHDALPFYWVDMGVYPGNSGGPIVEDDRLVGIVSAQAMESIDGMPDARTGIPFAKIIKSRHLRALLDEQQQKDRR